jgi:hypothetical protein
MFSKEEASLLRQEFWTSFGKSFPRKWLLYNTVIKGFNLKFEANRKTAMVCLDLTHPDTVANELLYNQMISLKVLLETELPTVIYDDSFELETGKRIHRIYVPFKEKFSIYNKNTWRSCYEFFVETMPIFELFYDEYEVILEQAI